MALAAPTMINVPTIALAMPPPILADRLRHVREEMPLERRPAQLEQVEQDEEERQRGDQRRQARPDRP